MLCLSAFELYSRWVPLFPLAIERDSAHAGSTIEDCILSYKSDLFVTIQHYTFCSTINFHLTKFYKTATYIS